MTWKANLSVVLAQLEELKNFWWKPRFHTFPVQFSWGAQLVWRSILKTLGHTFNTPVLWKFSHQHEWQEHRRGKVLFPTPVPHPFTLFWSPVQTSAWFCQLFPSPKSSTKAQQFPNRNQTPLIGLGCHPLPSCIPSWSLQGCEKSAPFPDYSLDI